jgi:hypothetical protein
VNFVVRRNKSNHFSTLSAVAALGCILLFWLPVRTAAQQEPPPGVNIQLEAAPKKATVGDPIQLTLDIATPPGYRAEILQPEVQEGDFAIQSFLLQPAATTPKGTPQHYKAKIVAAIYKTGMFAFPPIRIILEDDEGKRIQVSSPSVGIEIQSVIGKDQDLKDLKKQADIPEPFRWLLWLLIALAVCILALVARRFWRRKRSRLQAANAIPTRDPLDAAESDLRSLLDQGLPAAGREKKFYILLSNIVKRILEAGFGISTVEKTTSEIMDLFWQVPDMTGEKSELIESFLVSCDVVKFAKYIPSRPEHEIAAEKALKILAAAQASRQLSVVSKNTILTKN